VANIPLFCKSYHQDVLRVKRMMDSIEIWNKDKLTVYISVPDNDRQMFLNLIGSGRCEWLSDEEIIAANSSISWDRLQDMDGRKSQQVVKAEFWRLLKCNAYLCLDSDSVFIREFQMSDFLAADGTPYSTLHQSKDLLQLAINTGRHKLVENFRKECKTGKKLFNRTGPDYDFGPTPVIWSSKVWQDLADQYLEPRGMSFLDAVLQFPSELRWYGEALLAYRSIAIYPIEPLFRVYHTDWQYFVHRKQGETMKNLENNYLGVVMQSNWHYEMDYLSSDKINLSRIARKIKRQIKRFV
jgi:hypothetical protein